MPNTGTYLAQIYIKLNGQLITTEQMSQLISAEVDESLYLPDMFSLLLSDPDLSLLKADTFKPGGEITISIGTESASETLISGEITAVEPTLTPDGLVTLGVRGYSRAHRLTRIRKSKSYQEMTDSDIVSQLAQEGGLTAKATATSEVHPYLLQTNQTNWEFMVERARRIGYQLWVEERTLHFAPPPDSPPSTDLTWGENLAEFRARLSTVDQVKEVVVRGYDPKTKKEIVGTANSGTDSVSIGVSEDGGTAANKAHSISGKQVVVTRPVFSQAEADTMAQATMDEMNAGFIQAEGVSGGDPSIRAGNNVTIHGLGTRFNGDYMVTRTVHRYDQRGYSTFLWVSGGHRTASLTNLLQNERSATTASPTALGLVVGIVTNNIDPENMGRVRVKFPWLVDAEESWWCRIVTPMAGGKRGHVYFPEVNDEVVCGFQLGDPNHPYVLGAVWNGVDELPKPTSFFVQGEDGDGATKGQVVRRATYSRIGHNLIIDDLDPTSGIILTDHTAKNQIRINSDTHDTADTVRTTAKAAIVLTDNPETEGDITGQNFITVHSADATETPSTINATVHTGLVLTDKEGKNKILINTANHDTANTITITADQDLIVSATNGKITITAMGDIEVTTKAKLTVQSTGDASIKTDGNLSLEATNNVTIKGRKVTIQGSTGVTVQADGGPVEVKGLSVAIEAQTKADLKGLVVGIEAQTMATLKGNAGVEVSTPAIATVRGSLLNLN